MMTWLLVRGLSFVAYFKDFGICHSLIETGNNYFVTKNRTRALSVRLSDSMADSFSGRPLFLTFYFANCLYQPFLPDGLTGWPRVRLASFPHGLKNYAKRYRLLFIRHMSITKTGNGLGKPNIYYNDFFFFYGILGTDKKKPVQFLVPTQILVTKGLIILLSLSEFHFFFAKHIHRWSDLGTGREFYSKKTGVKIPNSTHTTIHTETRDTYTHTRRWSLSF